MENTSGKPPQGILYGSEYTEDDINDILKTDSRTSFVGRDVINHGNILAKIAAGNDGAVPSAYIVVVKLKPAKQYLRNYYFVKEDAIVYQENDIMLAVNYVRSVSLSLNMPISLCMTLGTNGRGHDGTSALSYIIDRFVSSVGAVVSMPTGDEGNKQLHGSGRVGEGDSYDRIEVRIDERQKGLVIYVWGGKPGLISVGLVSPTGEVIERVEPRIGKSEIYNLVFDGTTVLIEYDLVEGDTGDELILIRLDAPTAGIWSIRIYGDGQSYNVYLPVSQFIYENTYILEPDPDITIVDPALATGAITTSLYNVENGGLYIDNGRGYSRTGNIKPDISTVLSSGITAGAVCQILNWGVVEGKDKDIRATDIKSYLIRGAVRESDVTYPNRQWGYGKLDVYQSFEVLKG